MKADTPADGPHTRSNSARGRLRSAPPSSLDVTPSNAPVMSAAPASTYSAATIASDSLAMPASSCPESMTPET